jgi:hypothetical protein
VESQKTTIMQNKNNRKQVHKTKIMQNNTHPKQQSRRTKSPFPYAYLVDLPVLGMVPPGVMHDGHVGHEARDNGQEIGQPETTTRRNAVKHQIPEAE